MQVLYFSSFIFGVLGRDVGNEISVRYFVFNVCSSFPIFIYACCEWLNVGFTLVTASQWEF